MAENLGTWPSKRGPIAKFVPSDVYKRDAVPLAVVRWYNFHDFGCHPGNPGKYQAVGGQRSKNTTTAVQFWYTRNGFGGYLGNVGLYFSVKNLLEERIISQMQILKMIGASLLIFLLTFSAAQAQEKQLKGIMFVTIMNGNTLAGKNEEGIDFKAYFLSGGRATYEDAAGNRDAGIWHLKNDDRICVKWEHRKDGLEQCAIVTLEGRNISWKGSGGSGKAKLLGTILPGFPSR